MLETGHIGHVFDHLTAAWIPPSWHARISRVPAPEICRVYGRPWPVGGDCCIWLGGNDGKKSGPHGKVRFNGRMQYLHRIALSHHLGVDIAALDNIDHLCRNGLCFNPYHLEDTTPKENTDRGDGVIYQFKPKDQYGESTVTDEDLAALASGHIGSYRR